MKILLPTTSLVVALIPTKSSAENYEINVTRKGSNPYGVNGERIYIDLRYCYEYVYY